VSGWIARPCQLEISSHLASHEIDLRKSSGKFAGQDGERPIDGHVGVVNARTFRSLDVVLQFHRMRIAKFKPLQGLG
jgi:hypothetical protein